MSLNTASKQETYKVNDLSMNTVPKHLTYVFNVYEYRL